MLAVCAEFGFTAPADPSELGGAALRWLADRSDSQRAIMAARLATPSRNSPQFSARRSERITDMQASREFATSLRSVARARRVLETAPDEVIDAIMRGPLTLSEAERLATEHIVAERSPEPEPEVEPEPPTPIQNAPRDRRPGGTGARERKRKEVEALSVKVKALHDQGYGALEIARQLQVGRHAVNHAKTRLGLSAREGLLSTLRRNVEEFIDTWDVALRASAQFESAPRAERMELIEQLRVLSAKNRKLIARLNAGKSDQEEES